MREHDVRPRRDLGQNFLVDSNILGVIERLAELAPDDVVLEVGGGPRRAQRAPGAALRARARRRDRPGPRAGAAARRSTRSPNTTLHVADAMELDLAAPRPRADEGRRQPARTGSPPARSCARSRSCPRVDALGRDGAEGGRASGSPRTSATRCTASRRCSRSSRATSRSHGRSRAPSSSRSRTSTPCSCGSSAPARRRRPSCARLVRAAFAHRRKALPRSRSSSPAASRGDDVRARARAALEAIGHPADERAERLTPAEFRALRGGARAVNALAEYAPAKVNLGLTLGPTRADGRHELVTVMQPVDLCDRVRLVPGGARRRRGRGALPRRRGRQPRRRGAARVPRAHRLGRRPGPDPDREADPGRRRDGGRLGRRRRRAAARRARRGRARRRAAARDRGDARRRRPGPGPPAALPRDRRRRGPARAARPGAVRDPRRALAPPALDRRRLPRGGPPEAAAVRRSRSRRAARTSSPRSPRARRSRPATCSSTTSSRPPSRSCPSSPGRSTTCAAPAPTTRSSADPGPTVVGLFADVERARSAAVSLSGRDPRPVAVEPWYPSLRPGDLS